ncbi:hypothetical protein PEC18_00425 [Paucibacter sp. O1-1]|nr:hypothetical protein [Paucibacter sp. O1-1]MDA3824380.1 hypothetical protein [Paucibacter sp. O1-1]
MAAKAGLNRWVLPVEITATKMSPLWSLPQKPAAGCVMVFPKYRLPKAILDKEIELLTRSGLKIKTGCALERDTDLTELVANYDAVCLAIGAQKAVPMNYPVK